MRCYVGSRWENGPAHGGGLQGYCFGRGESVNDASLQFSRWSLSPGEPRSKLRTFCNLLLLRCCAEAFDSKLKLSAGRELMRDLKCLSDP